jgi:hypothetical protein
MRGLIRRGKRSKPIVNHITLYDSPKLCSSMVTMEVNERFASHLYRLGIRLLVGKASRCHFSISCYTPPQQGRSGVVSIHPELYGVRAAEALALQVGILSTTPVEKRLRITSVTPETREIARGWRWAARALMPAPEWQAAMNMRLEGADLEECFDVTPRLVQIRWNLWMAQTGKAGALFSDQGLYSLTPVDERLWCEGI